MMGLAAAVVGLRLLSLCSGPGSLWRGAWLPLPEGVIDASARGALLAFLLSGTVRSCNMPQRQMICQGVFARQPSSGVPGPPELSKESSGCKLRGVARLMTRCRGPNERQPPASHYAVRADSHGEAHGSAMFELRERDELPQPCQSTTEDGHIVFASEIAERQLKGNKQKFVARTHRERSAQRDTIKVPRHRSAARFHICRA